MPDKTILDMTLREIRESPDIAGITIKVLVHKIAPRSSSSAPGQGSQQPSKAEMANVLNRYAEKFGGHAARELIGAGTTLDQIMASGPDKLYRRILTELDAPEQLSIDWGGE